jgi:methyl-accepting chemotaxis protein
MGIGNLARRLFGVSLVRKQLVITIAVSFVTLAALIAMQTIDRARDTYALQEANEVSTSALLADQIAGALKWEKADVIQSTFAPIVANPENNMAALSAFDMAGKALVAYRSDKLPAFDLSDAPGKYADAVAKGRLARINSGSHFIVLAAVHGAKGERVGTLAIAWSRDRIDADVAKAVWRAVATATAGLLTLVLLQFLALHRFIAKPLQGMTAAMKRLAERDVAITVPGLDRNDELGTMAKAVEVFKANAVDKDRLEAAMEARAAAERAEREVQEAERAFQAELAALVEGAAAGDFSRRIEETGKAGLSLKLAQGMNRWAGTVSGALADVVRMMSALAGGNLGERVTGGYRGDLLRLTTDANTTADKLAAVVRQTRQGITGIKDATEQLAMGAVDLSSRTEEQVASLEEMAAAIRQLSSTVKQNADNAQTANQVAATTHSAAEKGGEVAGAAVKAMDEITQSSQRIGEIVGMIDEIAFQTNLLALNAAVEAARAGDAGRGFAVVAAEVRQLAQRSSVASKEIKTLIGASDTHVRRGVELVNKAGGALGEIVGGVKRVAVIVSEIAAASREQSAGVQEVEGTVSSMEVATQKNASLVEETTASLNAVDKQVEVLLKVIGFFHGGGSDERAGETAEDSGPVKQRRHSAA